MHAHIEESKASKETLGESDVLSLLDVLVHGGKVESYPLSAFGPESSAAYDADGDVGEDSRAFRFRNRLPITGGLLASPCGVCPVSFFFFLFLISDTSHCTLHVPLTPMLLR